MATEFDLSPPEVPEPTFFDNILCYGLFLGAIFQIICILSILLPPPSKSSEPEWEQTESKPSDVTKKQKPTTPSSGKKAKKESKKKR
ncbi:protein MANBAL [Heptranchias perlo]|uniref:protein MANBAL n=1 Tax=Heptranchias perlo TaxID=212740 RepID=UPI003559F818